MLTEDYSEVPRSVGQIQSDIVESMSANDIMACIAKLPSGYSTILNLYAIEGYSHAEIAEMLDISENTSRSQYSRAKVRLAEIMTEYFKERDEYGQEG